MIAVTRRITGQWEERLRAAGCELRLPPAGADAPMPRPQLLEHIKGADGVLAMLTDRFDAEAFDAAGPQLRVVANYAVGFNNIDTAEATRRGVAVTNTPDVLTAATADIAWALLMASARRLGESERDLRAGKFHGWGPNDYLGMDLDGKTLGILGPGRIGTVIAKRSIGWDMKVLYAHPTGKPDFERETGAKNVALDQLLRESDFIVSALPLNDRTKHLIGAPQFAIMKKTAVLVSVGRGPVIDEAALVTALREKQIFAAGLDVYEFEPKLADGLMQLENAVLLPHIGSGSVGARADMAIMAVDNILAAVSGKRPPQLVNSDWQPKTGA
ncbi:D-glycerate dehydrogenase [bacterium]|nr:D-glycerate dehydrogenase [bacterium]